MSTEAKFGFATTAEEVATAFAQEIKGKNVLITGTSLNGIGFEAARVIAKHANLVVITGYNDQRLKLSEDAIKKELPSANVRRLTLDLGSLAGVRKAAAEVNTYSEPIHVLIHNAAAAIGPFKLTVDGLESQMATDHVGPFLLTKLLAPKLLASATAGYTPRVVFVSSGAHAFGTGVDFDVLERPNPNFKGSVAYYQAKSANILTALELSKRSRGAINAYSLHPGDSPCVYPGSTKGLNAVVALLVIWTNINQKEESLAELQAIGAVGPDGQPSTEKFDWQSIAQGAATTVTASFDPRISDKPGAYLDDSTVANESVAAHSSDPANAARLWDITEKIIGEKFSF